MSRLYYCYYCIIWHCVCIHSIICPLKLTCMRALRTCLHGTHECTHFHACTHACTPFPRCTHAHTLFHACTHACTHFHRCTHVHTHFTDTHVRAHIFTHAHVHACTFTDAHMHAYFPQVFSMKQSSGAYVMEGMLFCDLHAQLRVNQGQESVRVCFCCVCLSVCVRAFVCSCVCV